MFRNFERFLAALLLAMLVVPQIALAATMSATSAVCLDDGVDDDNDPETACDNFTESSVRDGNVNTGNHIDGPEYPIRMTLDFGSVFAITGLDIYHMPAGGGGGDGNRIATNVNNKVYSSTNGTSWTEFGTIPAYDDSSDMVAEVTGSTSARYIRIINWENANPGAGWFPTEFVLTYSGSAVPEFGLWALVVVLPILFYLVYKSTPSSKMVGV